MLKSRGKFNEAEQQDLWDRLYLLPNETDQVLAWINDEATPAWLYPAVVFAAHTGARRSEILRAEIQDVEGTRLTLRERKRVRGKLTTRQVPISDTLRNVLDEWIEMHPGGKSLFCVAGLARSKTRRSRPESITRDMAHDHLKRALSGGKWSVIKGWHCFRHSFVSACAMKGIDQRLIEEWCGHMNESTSRLYRHLAPSGQADALKSVFG